MSCFVAKLKFSFISQLGVVMKFVDYGLFSCFYIGGSNNEEWHQKCKSNVHYNTQHDVMCFDHGHKLC
jgi:hypothetical protein